VTTSPTERSRNGGADQIPLPPLCAGRLGRLWLCGKHFIGPDPEAALHRVGADGAVCLSQASELADRYPAYVSWLRANQPGRAVWCPIPDLHAPDLAQAIDLLDDLRARLGSGQSLLMHCGAGIGRTGTVAAGLLITMGVPLSEAVARVGAHRPMAGPEVGAQTELLRALAARSLPASPPVDP
jgi:protein-tyrosine phosphatase